MMDDVLNKDDFMVDAQGRFVPKSMVSDVDQARDGLVHEIVAAAKTLQYSMQAFKARAMGDVQAFVDLSAEKYNVRLGGKKGNITLTSYDGELKVQVAISEKIAFDERLQAAKSLIDECLKDWTEESRDELKALVMDAFQVDQEGKLNTGRILGLRRFKIDDERWVRAMNAIGDSVQVVGSKMYLRIYERAGADGKWTALPLDLAAL